MESAEESDQINEVEAHEDQTNAEESNDILNVIHKSIDRIEKKIDNLNLNADKECSKESDQVSDTFDENNDDKISMPESLHVEQ